MNKYGRFGPLLGTIFVGNTHCKFLIFASRNAEVLTDYEVSLTQISIKPGWIEICPNEIWKSVVDCIQNATKNLKILDINIDDIVAIGITNQRETTIVWNKTTGTPLYNAIAWNDTRTDAILNKILTKIHNKKNYLKSVCGLPLSNCFSALKVVWLMENVCETKEVLQSNDLLFGTLDTWILWNLTGGVEGGIHVTDVTNASRTMLMNLESLQWDQNLCNFFRIPTKILPKIKSCSEIYGFVYDGPLQGVPIASCLGDQPASLLGQMCIQTSQATCTYNDSCFLMLNTGQEIIDSENGLLTTVGFKLGPKAKTFYALEGAVSNAGYGVSWLKDNMLLNVDVVKKPTSTISQSYLGESSVLSTFNSSSTLFDSTNSSNKTDVVFGKFHHLVAFTHHIGNMIHEANNPPLKVSFIYRVILGLNSQTSAVQVTLAAYEAICFQTRDLLESLAKDLPSWQRLVKLTVGGEFVESSFMLQLLADLCGITIERPQTTSPSCLGAMLASGVTMKLLAIDSSKSLFSPPLDAFHPVMCSTQRDLKYRRWKYAIMKCLRYNGNFTEISYEDRDPEMFVRNSIPGTVFLFTSIALLLATRFFQRT
ncbi:Glycerol kinase 2 [Pseudolycoriella hygida]|uniref:glycerol kinase n=1 Tax=Pseudolycoriella hygida TaxID=35572 RepID=A0A9Q0S8C8_9DIPT|nr:Glycerol kinase 2 [Pseudolycoriella hygida]